jgi:hypothetical protein
VVEVGDLVANLSEVLALLAKGSVVVSVLTTVLVEVVVALVVLVVMVLGAGLLSPQAAQGVREVYPLVLRLPV